MRKGDPWEGRLMSENGASCRRNSLLFLLLISLLMVMAANAKACDRTDLLVTTTPSPRQTAPQARASLQSLAALPSGPIETILIGDSLIARWSSAPSWTAKFGVSGDRTQNVLWRLDQAETARVRPNRAVLLIGTNNVTVGDLPCAIVGGILAIVERMHRLWPQAEIDVIGIPARGDKQEFEAARRETNALLRERITGGRFIDPDTVLTCAGQCESYEKDRIHFAPKGYKALGSLLAR